MFGGGDIRRYVRIGVTLKRVIAAQTSLMRFFTLIFVSRLLPTFGYPVYRVLLLDWKISLI